MPMPGDGGRGCLVSHVWASSKGCTQPASERVTSRENKGFLRDLGLEPVDVGEQNERIDRAETDAPLVLPRIAELLDQLAGAVLADPAGSLAGSVEEGFEFVSATL
jgi:hypothetical protein